MSSTATADTRVTAGEREAILDRAVADSNNHGWRVVSRSTSQAQMVKGKPTNHILHLLLTIITFGLWAVVWILVTVFAGEKRQLVNVDERGRVTRQ